MTAASIRRSGGRLRVLFVTPAYIPFISGARTFVEAMARRLAADGHAATVLTTNAVRASDFWRPPAQSHARLATQDVLDGVAVHRLLLTYPWPAPYAFGVLRRVGLWLHLSGLPSAVTHPVQSRLARSMPPLRNLEEASDKFAAWADVVHADDSSWDGMLMAAATAAARHRKPLVVSPLMHLGDAWVRAHYQMAHQVKIYKQASSVVALSAMESDALMALGVTPGRVRHLHMGVDGLPPEFENLDTAAFREQIKAGAPIVAFVGANTRDKGAFALARAVLQLNLEGTAVDLVCAGPQSEELHGFLRSQPREAKSLARVRIHVLGVVDETTKQRLLAACSLLALPSQVDTFGIVFLEAWQHGKPVIGAMAGGIPDLVQHEKTGLLVPFGNVDDLAAAIRRLLLEPPLAARLGAEGRATVQRAYTWDRTYEDQLAIYRGVLNAAGGVV